MEVCAPAKINLFLEVVGKRPDGYHNIRSLMSCISLYDTVKLNMEADKISVCCNHSEVPEDNTNLAFQAADLFYKALAVPGRVRIEIEKNIPVGAGLGGGSSNAAAVLVALNKYFDFPLTDKDLKSIGIGIGADVPFFIKGKPSVASGIGEQLEEIQGLRPYPVVLVNPGFSVFTAMVYKKFNFGLTKLKKINRNTPFSEMLSNIDNHLHNDLETVTATMFPEIIRTKKLLIKLGAAGALMTGSGPTVFGLFKDAESAKNAYDSLTHFSGKQKFLAEIIV
jgi:4-diphosphocytidyl-2-C-methyl-D-erythritol kinase